MDYEEAAAVVRSWGQKVTAYRVGIAMGEAEARAFMAWRDESKATRDYTKPRPPRAENPYKSRGMSRFATRHWLDGRAVGWRRAGLTPPPGGF